MKDGVRFHRSGFAVLMREEGKEPWLTATFRATAEEFAHVFDPTDQKKPAIQLRMLGIVAVKVVRVTMRTNKIRGEL